MLVELRPEYAADFNSDLANAAWHELETEFHLEIVTFGVCAKGEMPKTTSGKIRRNETQRLFRQSLIPCIAQVGAACHEPKSFDELLDSFGVRDKSLTLADNGVDSIRLIKFQSQAAERFGLRVPIHYVSSVPCNKLEGICQTGQQSPQQAAVVEAGYEKPLELPDRAIRSNWIRGIVELGVVLVVLGVFVACAIPAGYAHDALVQHIIREHPTWITPALQTFGSGPGLILLVTPLTFLVTLTIAMVLVKWLLIGRYRERTCALHGWYFYRFLVIDRLVSVWEWAVGGLLVETPYLNLVSLLLLFVWLLV